MVDRSDWIEDEPLGSVPITFDEEEEWEDDDWDDEDDEEEFEEEDPEEEEWEDGDDDVGEGRPSRPG